MTSVTVCRAKNPATCPHHGTPQSGLTADILNMYTKAQEALAQKNSQHPEITAKATIDHAIHTSLEWNGPKPKWWEKDVAEKAADKELPTIPVLIDVIDSPAGKLAVVWQSESQEDNDRYATLDSGLGVRICYFKSMETGETLGYIKMAHMDDITFERTFGNDEFTPFRWKQRYGGSQFGLTDYSDRGKNRKRGAAYQGLQGEELASKRREVWLHAQRNLGGAFKDEQGNYVASYNLSEKHIPDDDSRILKDLKTFSKKIDQEVVNKREFYKTPYVDYSKVEGSLKGKGFGTALYVYTARMLAKENKLLRGSGIQSDEAETAWKRFSTNFPKNFVKVESDYMGEKNIYSALDFRN